MEGLGGASLAWWAGGGLGGFAGATVLRATIVLGGALALAAALHRSSGSARHGLWTVTMCALVLLPVLTWGLPALRVPLPEPVARAVLPVLAAHPDEGVSGSGAAPASSPHHEEAVVPAHPMLEGREGGPQASADRQAPAETGRSGSAVGQGTASAGPAPQRRAETGALAPGALTGAAGDPSAPPRRISLAGWFLMLWAAGASVPLVSLAFGLVGARRLARSGSPAAGPRWAVCLDRARHAAGVSRPIRLRLSPHVGIAMTGGILRPFILLPEAASSWSEERREVVLLHELIHIRRSDTLRQVGSRIALSIYWFNPLTWCAVRMAGLAREQACDEAVLALGHRPSVYARHLLELADHAAPAVASSALVSRPHLEKRIMTILRFDPRRRSTRPVLAASILGAVWALSVAAAAPRTPAPAPAPGQDAGVLRLAASPPSVPPAATAAAGPTAADRPVGTETASPPSIGFSAERPADPEQACRPGEEPGRFAPQRARAGEWTTALTPRFDDLSLCAWVRGELDARELATRIDSLAPGSAVVVASAGARGIHRLEITPGSAGPEYRWSVDGADRPFDAAAREWRDAIFEAVGRHVEIIRIRSEEARLRARIARVYADEARVRGDIARVQGEQARIRAEAMRGQAEHARAMGELGRIQAGQAGLQAELARVHAEGARLQSEVVRLRTHAVALERAQQATGDPETRARLERETAELRSRIEALHDEGLQERRAALDATAQERRRHIEEYRARHEADVARLEAELATHRDEVEVARREMVRELAAHRERTAERIEEAQAAIAERDVTGDVAEVRRLIEELDARRRIAELEQALEGALDRLRAAIEQIG